ncbi:MAG: hypothetical protein ACLGH0_15395 [Thermoanaerobaculia bacterium]
MEATEIIRRPDPRASVRINFREVVRDVGEKPHVFIRVTLTGWRFSTGAYDYALLIGNTVSRFTRVSADRVTLYAYFDRPIPRAEVVTLVYGKTAIEDFRFDIEPQRIPRLERSRLPKGVADPFG